MMSTYRKNAYAGDFPTLYLVAEMNLGKVIYGVQESGFDMNKSTLLLLTDMFSL